MEKTTVKGNPCGWERARGLMDSEKKLHEPKPHSFFNRIRKLALNKEESEQNYKIPALNVRLSAKQCYIFVYSVGVKLRLAKYLIRPARTTTATTTAATATAATATAAATTITTTTTTTTTTTHKESLKFWILQSRYLLFPFDLHEKYE